MSILKRQFIGWLMGALVCSGAVAETTASPPSAAENASPPSAAESDAPVVVRCAYPADGATDAALGEVQLPDIGRVTLRGLRKGIDVVVTVVAPNGASIGHTETLVGLSPASPVLVPSEGNKDGLVLILIHWKQPGK